MNEINSPVIEFVVILYVYFDIVKKVVKLNVHVLWQEKDSYRSFSKNSMLQFR